jgi:phosphoserine phosphatase
MSWPCWLGSHDWITVRTDDSLYRRCARCEKRQRQLAGEWVEALTPTIHLHPIRCARYLQEAGDEVAVTTAWAEVTCPSCQQFLRRRLQGRGAPG